MKTVLSVFYFFMAAAAAQQPDFILFKKKGRTIKTYFAGSNIIFTSTTGASIEAKILSIQNDSLSLQQFITRQVPTQLGVYILDTSFYYYKYHYKQIASIIKTGRRFDLKGSGYALMGGGLLLTVASGIAYLADSKKFSPELLAASVGLAGVGYLLTRTHGDQMTIGKKYSLEYVKAVDTKNHSVFKLQFHQPASV